jgi:hypothetical protein
MNTSIPTRLADYVTAVLAAEHGHRRNAVTVFVLALISVQSCCQARLARFIDNHEAALKRLQRLLRNDGFDDFVLAHALFLVARLPRCGLVRVAIDWTSEGSQHLLVASLVVGRRAVPLLWKAYASHELKGHTHEYERALLCLLISTVLKDIAGERVLVTADRGFGDVETIDELKRLKVAFILRAKGCVTVEVLGCWRKLNTLSFRRNERRRGWGSVRYCGRSPRKVWLTHARQRDRNGRWGIWFLISNRRFRATTASREYARRFGCEEGFRDAKRLLGFAEARIRSLRAWERMFTLVAVALAVLTHIGSALGRKPASWREYVLRGVRSRRRHRSELSLVRAVTELLDLDASIWDLLDPHAKLNLEAGL